MGSELELGWGATSELGIRVQNDSACASVPVTAVSPLVFSMLLGVVGQVYTHRSSPPEAETFSEASQCVVTKKLEHLGSVPGWAERVIQSELLHINVLPLFLHLILAKR